MHIDTDSFSKRLRSRIIRHQDRSLLIARLPQSDMAKDRYTRINCSGFGRVRIFETYSLHMESLGKRAPRPLLRGHPPVFPFEPKYSSWQPVIGGAGTATSMMTDCQQTLLSPSICLAANLSICSFRNPIDQTSWICPEGSPIWHRNGTYG